MTPAEAAAILRVPTGASAEQVERAYRARARESHPDRFAGASERVVAAAEAQFVLVGQARSVLASIAGQSAGAGASGFSGPTAYATAPRFAPGAETPVYEEADPPQIQRRLGWAAVVVWSGLLLFAVTLSFNGGPLAFSHLDFFARLLPLVVVTIAYAVTGFRILLILTALLMIASVVLTIAFVSFGSLIALEVLLVPVIGLVLIGRRRRPWRR